MPADIIGSSYRVGDKATTLPEDCAKANLCSTSLIVLTYPMPQDRLTTTPLYITSDSIEPPLPRGSIAWAYPDGGTGIPTHKHHAIIDTTAVRIETTAME